MFHLLSVSHCVPHVYRQPCTAGYGGQIPYKSYFSIVTFGDLPHSTPVAKCKQNNTTHVSVVCLFCLCSVRLGGWVVWPTLEYRLLVLTLFIFLCGFNKRSKRWSRLGGWARPRNTPYSLHLLLFCFCQSTCIVWSRVGFLFEFQWKFILSI